MNSEAQARPPKSFGSQILSFGVVQLILRLRGLITLPILSRLIGTAGYGLLSPLTALAAIVPSFILLGAPTALTVFIPGKPREQKRRDFWAIAQLAVVSGLIVFTALLALFPYIQQALLSVSVTFSLFVAAMAVIPFSALQMTLYAQTVNNQQGRAYSKIAAVTSAFDLFLLVAGAYWFGVIGVLYATLISQAILCGFMIWMINTEDKFMPLSLQALPDLKKYYAYGLVIFVAGFGSWAIDSSDRFIIGKFLTTDTLGVYQVAYNLCTQLNQLAAPLFAPLMPFVVAAINENDPDRARYYLEKSLKLLLFIYVPAVILFSVNAADLIAVLATPDFIGGAVIVPYVAAGIAVSQLVGVYTYTLHAHKRGYLLVFSLGVAALINVVLNLIFVPVYGIVAAAVSTLIAYAFHFGACWYFSRQSLKIGLDAVFSLKLTGISAITILISVLVKLGAPESIPALRFAVSALAGGCAYLFMTYLFRLFSPAELAPVFENVKRFIPDRSK
jgi:O-antigen/teichoic acid export membrane protein